MKKINKIKYVQVIFAKGDLAKLCKRKNTNIFELARELGETSPNLYNINAGIKPISEARYQKIINKLEEIWTKKKK